jgi:hypothetical protein
MATRCLQDAECVKSDVNAPLCAENNNVVLPCMSPPNGGVCDTWDEVCRFNCNDKRWRAFKGSCTDPGACCRYGEASAMTFISCSQAKPDEIVERNPYGCVITARP